MATIVILEHLMQAGFNHPYIVYALAERWRTAGHEVLIHYGTSDPPPGDIAIVNIDLTVIPPAYVALFERYPRVINRATTSIAKRGFSQLILDRDSTWRGPVIVKTDANFGGRIDLERAILRERVESIDAHCASVGHSARWRRDKASASPSTSKSAAASPRSPASAARSSHAAA